MSTAPKRSQQFLRNKTNLPVKISYVFCLFSKSNNIVTQQTLHMSICFCQATILSPTVSFVGYNCFYRVPTSIFSSNCCCCLVTISSPTIIDSTVMCSCNYVQQIQLLGLHKKSGITAKSNRTGRFGTVYS